jgi:hypothetical protein
MASRGLRRLIENMRKLMSGLEQVGLESISNKDRRWKKVRKFLKKRS